jgi:hypothetical protein
MKQLARFLLLLALAITCGCGGGSNSMSNSSAQLRSIVTSGDGSGFDVQVDGHTVFPKGSIVAYKPVALGSHTLGATAPGTNTALTSLASTFAADSSQTVVTSGDIEDQSLTQFLVTEDTTAPPAGQIKFRFVHGAHAVGPIDIYVTDAGGALPATPTFANVAFKSATPVVTRADQGISVCWVKAGTTFGPFGGACSWETFGGTHFPKNSTLVLPDVPVVPNAPPGTFVLLMFGVYGN